MTGETAPGGRAMALTLVLCVVAAMCEGMDVQVAGLAAAGLKGELAPTPGQLGLFFAAANLGLGIGAVAGGRLADRIGRKPVLTASILTFGLCALATAAARDMTMLTAARLATGLGLGGAMPNLLALAADISGVRSKNAAIGLTYIGMPVGGASAALVARALPAEAWRTLFVIGGVVPLVLGVLIALFLKAPAGAGRPEGHARGPVSALFARERLGWTLALWLGFFGGALVLHLILNWLPLILQGRGLARTDAATAQIALNLLGAVGALLVGLGLDTRWRPLVIMAAALAVPAALLALAQAPTEAAILAAGLLGAGVLSQTVILFGVAGGGYPAAMRGTALGAAVGVSRVGALVGPSLAAVLLSAGRPPTEVLTSLLPVVAATGLVVVWLGWRARSAAVAAA